MSYLKPNGYDIRYNVTLSRTYTQHKYDAIRFIGDEVPNDYTDGFIYYDDNDRVICDLSSYKYFYSQNIYAVSEDEITYPKPNNTPSGGGTTGGISSALVGMVQELKTQVSEMETYAETKKVYIHDTQVVFETDKKGAISTQLKVNNIVTPCVYSVEPIWTADNQYTNRITVTFEELEDVGEVTLFIIPTVE